jgi:hypothetical protein
MSWRRRPRPPLVKRQRRSLGLSQLQFPARYRIDVRQLRAWERRLAEPTHAELAYIKIVASPSPKSWHPNWHRTARDRTVKQGTRCRMRASKNVGKADHPALGGTHQHISERLSKPPPSATGHVSV